MSSWLIHSLHFTHLHNNWRVLSLSHTHTLSWRKCVGDMQSLSWSVTDVRGPPDENGRVIVWEGAEQRRPAKPPLIPTLHASMSLIYTWQGLYLNLHCLKFSPNKTLASSARLQRGAYNWLPGAFFIIPLIAYQLPSNLKVPSTMGPIDYANKGFPTPFCLSHPLLFFVQCSLVQVEGVGITHLCFGKPSCTFVEVSQNLAK